MKKWLLLTLPLLSACASPITLTDTDAALSGSGSLDVIWLAPNSMEIQLNGQRYVGNWSSSLCFTDSCRGPYRNVPRIHRRHIQRGQAELLSQNGMRMNCEWVSHLPELQGTCTTQDGCKYLLAAKLHGITDGH